MVDVCDGCISGTRIFCDIKIIRTVLFLDKKELIMCKEGDL